VVPSLRYDPPIHNVFEGRLLSLRVLHVSQRYYGPVIGNPWASRRLPAMILAPILGLLLARNILSSRARGIPQKRDQGWSSRGATVTCSTTAPTSSDQS
jgi:hypothetical protein